MDPHIEWSCLTFLQGANWDIEMFWYDSDWRWLWIIASSEAITWSHFSQWTMLQLLSKYVVHVIRCKIIGMLFLQVKDTNAKKMFRIKIYNCHRSVPVKWVIKVNVSKHVKYTEILQYESMTIQMQSFMCLHPCIHCIQCLKQFSHHNRTCLQTILSCHYTYYYAAGTNILAPMHLLPLS